MNWPPELPEVPDSISKISIDRVQERAARAWCAAHTLQAAIAAWIEWTHAPTIYGSQRGDDIVRTGRAAIAELRALNVNCDAFRHRDDPENPGPLSWWPMAPSEHLDPTFYEDRSCHRNQAHIQEICSVLGVVLKPAVKDLIDLLRRSPTTALRSPAGPCQGDGPQAPDLFWWRGKSIHLPSLQWRLIDALWVERSLPEVELIEQVWGDESTTTNRAAVAMNRANSQFEDHGIPVRLVRKNGFFTLIVDPHQPQSKELHPM